MRTVSIQLILVLVLLATPVLELFAYEEFLVNTYTDGDQSGSDVAVDDSGNFVITWQSGNDQDGDSYGIFAQMYNSDGTKNGGEFQVNSYTINSQGSPSITMNSSGSFIIAWTSKVPDQHNFHVYVQMFDNDGTKKGDEFRVNADDEIWQSIPSVVMNDSGNFVLAWMNMGQDGDIEGIYARRFDSEGNPTGEEFRVNTYTKDRQIYPSIAIDEAGNFIISWQSYRQDGSGEGIYAQRFSHDGNPVGEEFRVNTYTDSSQNGPSVAMDSEGNFVIAWYGKGEQASNSIYAQRYDSTGNPIGSEFLVNTYTRGTHEVPSIAMDKVGNFIITWVNVGQDGSGWGVYAQRYDHDGNPVDDEFRINTYIPARYGPCVALCDTGDYVITWSSKDRNDPSSECDIYYRKSNFSGNPQIDIYANKNYNRDRNYFEPYTLGERVEIGIKVNNPQSEKIDMYAAQLVGDLFYWYPFWDQTPHSTLVETDIWNNNVLEFKIGEDFSEGTYTFYAALTEHDTFDAIYMDAVEIEVKLPLPAVDPLAYDEFLVNSYTYGSQDNPSIAADGSGNFVITWECGLDRDGDETGVFAQMYNSDGTKNGSEFQVNTYFTKSQSSPSIAMNSSGNFVVAWVSSEQDGSGRGVYAQMYNSDGTKEGSEFQVNSYTENDQHSPTAAMDDVGNFVITWQSLEQDGSSYHNINAQMFNNDGTKKGDEFRVRTNTGSFMSNPSVAMDTEGNFIITWQSKEQVGSFFDNVYARKYDHEGNPVGEEFLVNTYTDGNQEDPSVAMDGEGNFIIPWQDSEQDGSYYGVYAQRYDSNGNPVGSDFLVNTYTSGSQEKSSISMDKAGNFVITWQSKDQDGSGWGVYARKYDNNGNPIEDEFRVNTYMEINYSTGTEPCIALCDTGDYIITWHRRNEYNSGSDLDIYARKLNLVGKPQVDIYANKKRSSNDLFPYGSGDTVEIGVKVNNPQSEEIDMYAAQLVGDAFCWYPAWDQTPHSTLIETDTWKNNVLEFEVDDNTPRGTLTFYAAITEHNTYNLLYLDSVEITIETVD